MKLKPPEDIDTDTGWRIMLGRGLDIYRPGELNENFVFESHNPSLRNCKGFGVTYVKTSDKDGA